MSVLLSLCHLICSNHFPSYQFIGKVLFGCGRCSDYTFLVLQCMWSLFNCIFFLHHNLKYLFSVKQCILHPIMHFLNAGAVMGLTDKTEIEQKQEQNNRRYTSLGRDAEGRRQGWKICHWGRSSGLCCRLLEIFKEKGSKNDLKDGSIIGTVTKSFKGIGFEDGKTIWNFTLCGV